MDIVQLGRGIERPNHDVLPQDGVRAVWGGRPADRRLAHHLPRIVDAVGPAVAVRHSFPDERPQVPEHPPFPQGGMLYGGRLSSLRSRLYGAGSRPAAPLAPVIEIGGRACLPAEGAQVRDDVTT